MIKQKFNRPEELPVWKKAHELTLLVYKITKRYPKYELYGLISQLRRSCSSVPANITEGFYRKTTKELIQFLYNARGSLGETIYHIRLSKDLDYINNEDYNRLVKETSEVGKQLNGLIKSLKSKI